MFDERDVLLKAASIVEQGWCQNGYYDSNKTEVGPWLRMGEFVKACAAGASRTAVLELTGGRDIGLYARVEDMLSRQVAIPAMFDSIAEWNDAEGRTADEVADAMRQVATGF